MRIPFWLRCAVVFFTTILRAPYEFISSAKEEYFKVSKEQALGEKIRLWLRWALEVLKSILTFPYVYVSWVRKTYSQVLRERALVDRERALVELNELEEIPLSRLHSMTAMVMGMMGTAIWRLKTVNRLRYFLLETGEIPSLMVLMILLMVFILFILK